MLNFDCKYTHLAPVSLDIEDMLNKAHKYNCITTMTESLIMDIFLCGEANISRSTLNGGNLILSVYPKQKKIDLYCYYRSETGHDYKRHKVDYKLTNKDKEMLLDFAVAECWGNSNSHTTLKEWRKAHKV